jgi:uncharacterized protein (TIGR03067 family)
MRWKTISILVASLFIWSAGISFAGLEEDAEKELRKFQGVWEMVSGEVSGKKVADEDAKRSKIEFEGKNGKVVTPHQSADTIVFEIVKLDPTQTPKRFHFIRKTGPSAGKEIIGIYEFESDDKYKFAFDPTGVMVPKDFATKEGTGHIRHSWKKVKP